MNYSGKHVLVLGLGESGLAMARWLVYCGAGVRVADTRGEAALAERLRWVLEHPAEAEEMGRRARAFAARFFSTEKYLQGYGQIFEAAQALAGGQE